MMDGSFNLEQILAEFSDDKQRDLRFIFSLSLLPKPKIAFHAADADGIVSAIIIKNLKEFQDSVFIPLQFQEIRHQKFGAYLRRLNWIAIVDLPPFNESLINLYCDHHHSNKSLAKSAGVVLFDENAPSTAYLLSKYFDNRLPDSLKQLADLTTITDTASFTIPPEEEIPANFADITRQEQAWLLEDICHTPESTEEVNTLFQDISNQGVTVFRNEVYNQRIQSLRTLRKKSFKLGEQIEHADVIIIIRGREKIMTSALVHRLFEKGVKITCVIFPGKSFTGISLRVNPQVPILELERYRVDTLAKGFSGGGHPRAAGGRGTTLQKTMKTVIKWIQEKEFSHKQYDLRKPSA